MRRLAFFVSITALLMMGQGLSGRRAPGFSLPDPNFGQHDLADYRGKWLIIEFMRTNCPQCKALSKLLESKKAEYGAKVAVLDVVITPPETQVTVNKFIAENNITNPIVFDQGQMALSYFKATPAHSNIDMPHLFAIDPNGNIARDWNQDEVVDKGFPAALDSLINGKK